MYDYLIVLGIGFVAGLRTFTAPAAVSWGAYFSTTMFSGTPYSFMGSKAAVAIFTVLALGEYVGDLLPKTPSRTALGPLIARIISGAFCGYCLFAASHLSGILGALPAAVGAVIGAFAGYNARKKLVETLKVKDAMIAIPEDLVAIALAYVIVVPFTAPFR
jgi:uncharacterized membrane protein